jgi:hypothetical protein
MRSVRFLLEGDPEQVAAALDAASCRRVDDGARWSYPGDDETGLSLRCEAYAEADEAPETLAALRPLQGRGRLQTSVRAEVHGQGGCDREMHYLVGVLLGGFRGFAFDDFTWPHPWTLDEIAGERRWDGLRFFDHIGHYERQSR